MALHTASQREQTLPNQNVVLLCNRGDGRSRCLRLDQPETSEELLHLRLGPNEGGRTSRSELARGVTVPKPLESHQFASVT